MPKVVLPYRKAPPADLLTSNGDGVFRPMLFQVCRVGSLEPLWPYALALHTNPGSMQEQFTKVKTVAVTRGGFVEWVWPDDLDTLSADGTTGGFIGPQSGLTSDPKDKVKQYGSGKREFRGRQGTMAWERHNDLLDLFRSNGHIYNGRGVPVLRSKIMCIYDRGIYTGLFTTFEESEAAETPFQFKLTWEFKVQETKYIFPASMDMQMQRKAQDSQNAEEAKDRLSYQKDAQYFSNKGNVEQPVDPSVSDATGPAPSDVVQHHKEY